MFGKSQTSECRDLLIRKDQEAIHPWQSWLFRIRIFHPNSLFPYHIFVKVQAKLVSISVSLSSPFISLLFFLFLSTFFSGLFLWQGVQVVMYAHTCVHIVRVSMHMCVCGYGGHRRNLGLMSQIAMSLFSWDSVSPWIRAPQSRLLAVSSGILQFLLPPLAYLFIGISFTWVLEAERSSVPLPM